MKVVLGILAAILGVVAVLGGFGIGLGMIAYSVYLIVLMVKGTVVCTFFGIFKVIVYWIMAGFCGWLWAMFFGFLASLCVAGAGANTSKW
jgi:hypothetical protein